MKKAKVLLVIPAYNESENIEKVLKEIKKDVNYANILVINDCSKDNTVEILTKNKVSFISNVFNMGYAMSVHTGIKYAYRNNYDYVIQMDADGQHNAKDALALFNAIQEKKCDIVIGSRYLKKTDYNCPAMRRVGTKIFEKIIKLFCGKKITDPTSGFQCINRKVIAEYAQSGFYPEYPDANLIIEMLYRGYKIKEISVNMRKRESGESMHGGILQPISYMIQMFYAIMLVVLQNIRRPSHE